MKYPENIKEIASLNPDFMGFIFYKKSPRNMDNELPEIPTSVKKVGVFVNESFDFIEATVKQYQLDLVQLHGEESPNFCKEIENNLAKVIKSFSVSNCFDFSCLEKYNTSCSYFLFDTKATLYGGNGFSFDWSLLKHYSLDKPYFLSGGIGPENKEALEEFLLAPEAINCYAIDLNSLFETAPGIKDKQLLENYLKSTTL